MVVTSITTVRAFWGSNLEGWIPMPSKEKEVTERYLQGDPINFIPITFKKSKEVHPQFYPNSIYETIFIRWILEERHALSSRRIWERTWSYRCSMISRGVDIDITHSASISLLKWWLLVMEQCFCGKTVSFPHNCEFSPELSRASKYL